MTASAGAAKNLPSDLKDSLDSFAARSFHAFSRGTETATRGGRTSQASTVVSRLPERSCPFGAKVSVVEFMDRLIPGADPEIVKPLARRIEKRYEKIMLKTKVAKIEAKKDGLVAGFEGESIPATTKFDRVLVAVAERDRGPIVSRGRVTLAAPAIRVAETTLDRSGVP